MSLDEQVRRLEHAGDLAGSERLRDRLEGLKWSPADLEAEAQRLFQICLDMEKAGDADYSGVGLDLVAFEEGPHWERMHRLVEAATNSSTLDRDSPAEWIVGALHQRIIALVRIDLERNPYDPLSEIAHHLIGPV